MCHLDFMSFFKYNHYGDLEEKADKINLTKKTC
jgi:hypothetical protein